MTKIDSLKSGAALGLGALLAAANPKNFLLIAGAAMIVAQADLGSADTIVSIAVFTLIAACTVAIPTLAYLVMGAKAQPALDGAKSWLMMNNTAIMAVLLLVFGVSLVGKGLGALV